MGALAGRLLLRQIRGETVPRTAITLQPELIVRQSCRADRHGRREGHHQDEAHAHNTGSIMVEQEVGLVQYRGKDDERLRSLT
jgi:hypothetical protein